jgi:hypothetical protein
MKKGVNLGNKSLRLFEKIVSPMPRSPKVTMNGEVPHPGKDPGKGPGQAWLKNSPRRMRSEKTSADTRQRSIYEIPFIANRFCPRIGFRAFMAEVDKILELDKKFEVLQDQALKVSTGIYKMYGLPQPYAERTLEKKRIHYAKVVNSYMEVRRQLMEPNSNEKPNFNILLASLEALGCIILNPKIIDLCFYDYADEELTTAHLQVNFFTTKWTSSLIESLNWKPGEIGVEIKRKEKECISYSFEQESVKEPGKDPTEEIDIRQLDLKDEKDPVLEI